MHQPGGKNAHAHHQSHKPEFAHKSLPIAPTNLHPIAAHPPPTRIPLRPPPSTGAAGCAPLSHRRAAGCHSLPRAPSFSGQKPHSRTPLPPLNQTDPPHPPPRPPKNHVQQTTKNQTHHFPMAPPHTPRYTRPRLSHFRSPHDHIHLQHPRPRHPHHDRPHERPMARPRRLRRRRTRHPRPPRPRPQIPL